MPSTRADSSLFPQPALPDFSRERALHAAGCLHVAGVDEAGRGPLAGPVVVATVILDPARIPAGLDDSKALSEKHRQQLFPQILETALAVSIVSASAEQIDADNILAATLKAMTRALEVLSIAPCHALIDGNRLPPASPCPATAVIGGDGLSVSIAAASIVAKVTRDAMMAQADAAHPAYGFASHKGYGGARTHRDALSALGGVPRLHRFTFAPLK